MTDETAAPLNDHRISAAPPVTEPTPAPEIFVDDFANISITNGVAKFEYCSLVGKERRIVVRITAPIPLVFGLNKATEDLIAKLQDSGVVADARAN